MTRRRRRRWMLRLGAVLALLVGAAVTVMLWPLTPRGEPLALGAEAPPIALPDPGGGVHTLPAGSAVVVVFYRGHW